jgi:tight adherence protein C
MTLSHVVLIVAVVTGAAAVLLVAVAITLPEARRDRILRILAMFTGITPADEGRHQAVRSETTGRRTLDRIGLVLGPPGDREHMSRLLDQAGNPPDWPLSRLIRLRPLAALALCGLGAAIGNGWSGRDAAVFGAVAGFVGGCFLPRVLVYNASVKRQELILRSLPDVMDALVIGVEAGLGVDAAMDQVARTMRGPMADELHRVLQEMRLGMSRSEALRALSDRTTVRDLKRLVTALVQAGDLGISVGAILREHANDQRLRRRQRAEELAQKIPVKLLFPVLFCMFPAIFVVIVGPAALELIEAFSET